MGTNVGVGLGAGVGVTGLKSGGGVVGDAETRGRGVPACAPTDIGKTGLAAVVPATP